MCAPDKFARSKQQLDRFAFARSVFLKLAILKLIKRKSSLERSAESKLIPCEKGEKGKDENKHFINEAPLYEYCYQNNDL